MTQKTTLKTLRDMGLKASFVRETNEYRVTLPSTLERATKKETAKARAKQEEAWACYSDDAEDALGTGRQMLAAYRHTNVTLVRRSARVSPRRFVVHGAL